jgi:hypothetical protein
MKFWCLVSYCRSCRDKLGAVFEDPKWAQYAALYRAFDESVLKQDRSRLDFELPNELCREALSFSPETYVVEEGNLRLAFPSDDKKLKRLTALDVFDLYGGDCLEEVAEYSSYKVQ